MRVRRILALSVLLSIAVAGARAEDKSTGLKPGDPAPTLDPGRWISGESVPRLEPGRIYLVDFFATWHGPCRISIPYVSALAAKYRGSGVQAIGIAVLEQDFANVEPFISNLGDKVDYPIAVDNIATNPRGSMLTAWAGAGGQSSLPRCVVVDQQGLVAWIGNPLCGLDRVLKEMIDGSFDREAEAKKSAQRYEWQKQVNRAAATKDPKVVELVDEIYAADPEFGHTVLLLKFNALYQAGNYSGAHDMLRRYLEGPSTEVNALNDMAWTIVTLQDRASRDLEVAYAAASAANLIAQGKRADILDTLATIEFERGNLDAAIDLATRAVSKCDGLEKDAMVDKLNEYQSKKRNPGR